jgi:hypothetical protein
MKQLRPLAWRFVSRCILIFLAASGVVLPPVAGTEPISHVIHISVDGLRPDAITNLGPANLPNFYRLRTEGAFTHNARSDYDYTDTLPNHCTQLTGRGVKGPDGHNWTSNSVPPAGVTLASKKGVYVAGVFDVAHDHGLRTGEYASKDKFCLFDWSWNATNGAPDITGTDNGQGKIDIYVNTSDTAALVNTVVANMKTQALHYAFIHLTDPDSTGHSKGWYPTNGSEYCETIKLMDTRLGAIFDLVTTNAQLAGRTAILLTADHGGTGTSHGDKTLASNYTIPFYVWGPGVMGGAPLYTINQGHRLDPGTGRPTYSEPVQPIRNGEAANVSLQLLGLPAVPGSTLGVAQDLALSVPPPNDFRLLAGSGGTELRFSTIANVLYDVEARNDLNTGSWTNIAANIIGTGGTVTNTDAGAVGLVQRFYRLRLHF